MCGNDYLDYALETEDGFSFFGAGQMMSADEFVNSVLDRSDPDRTTEMALEALRVNTLGDVCEDIKRFRLRVMRAGFPLTVYVRYDN